MFKKIVGAAALGGVAVFGIGAVDNTTRNDQGAIVEAGELGAFVTQVGDCFFEVPREEGGISTVPGVPCTEAHHWQVVHKEEIYLSEYSASEVDVMTEQACDEALQSIVGGLTDEKYLEYQNASVSRLQPTEGSWGKDDRTVDCLVGNHSETYYSSLLG
jgi:hypothetical protein